MSPASIVASYFLIQAIGTVAWWMLLIAYPPSVKWFQPVDWPVGSLLSFWLADFVLIIAGSIIAATGVVRRHDWAGNVVWGVALVRSVLSAFCTGSACLIGVSRVDQRRTNSRRVETLENALHSASPMPQLCSFS